MKSQEKKWKFSLKKWDKQQWMILLLLGLILLVMAIPTKKISQTVSQKKTGSKNTMAGSGIYENLYGNSNADAQVLTEKAV